MTLETWKMSKFKGFVYGGPVPGSAGFYFGQGSGGPGICSGASPALVHVNFVNSRFYTRTSGQVGITSNDFADLQTFTGPAGRTYTNADGDLVTVGLNEPRLGNHIDTGSGLFDAGLLLESEERTNLWPNSHTLNPSSTPSGGTGASPVYNIYPQNSVQTLPDGATGADDGVGFTCTGIASDGDGGFWVGNLGRPSQSSVAPAEPQLVRVNSDASAIMSAIPTSFQMQGVAKRNDVLYYVRQTAGVYHIDTDGSGEALAFAVTGANGIAYDQTRDRFWLSVGTVISLRTIDGSVDASFDIGGETIDHLYHDPIRDVLWVSSGANNAIANIRIVQPDGTVLKAMSLEDGYAVEGIVVEGNEVVCVYDGFFHAPDGVPVPNQLNTLKKHKVVFGPSGMPADYVQFDKGAGTSSGDYSILQLPGLTVASGRYTQSVYTMNDEEGDVDVSFRITSDGYETKTVGDEWSRISYTTAADQTVLATQILLRGTYGTSETASLWFDIMQVEAGQVATSPIITTDSPVTLAGETLQIDAPVLARAIGSPGPELWEAGDVSAGPLWSESGGVYTKASVGNAVLGLTTLTANSAFVVSFKITATTSVLNLWRRNDADTANEQVASNLGTGTHEIVVRTTSSTNTDGQFLWFDGNAFTGTIENISFRKVTMPAAVSIAIEGYMTYADGDSSTQVLFTRWLADGNNFIETRLHTGLPSSTGDPFFLQSSSGAVSSKFTNTSPYTPGTNVPFSLASRHGATFINGAYGGNVLTEDTTPTSLPDLIASDFQIAPIFNGNITSLTIWADDITDPGIQAATAEGSGFNPLCPFDG